jgi:hypothetical protein
MAWQHILYRYVDLIAGMFLNTENISAFVGFSWKIECVGVEAQLHSF